MKETFEWSEDARPTYGAKTMNKEEIIEVAKLAEDYLPDLDPQEEFYTICESLKAAARLLEQVEVVEEGSEPMIGDLLASTRGIMGGVSCGYLVAKSWTPPNETVANDKYWTIQSRFGDGRHPDRFWANPKEWQTIRERNNRPVITIKKGEV